MKIIKEDESMLIFEVRPIQYIDKWSVSVVTLYALLILSYGISINYFTLQIFLFTLIVWASIICLSYLFFRNKKISVEVNRYTGIISISGLINTYFGIKKQPTEIPIQLVTKIEYDTIWWSWFHRPLFSPFLVAFNIGKLVFILNSNEKINLYTYAPLVSYKSFAELGKKIAEYIKVPFEY